MYALYVSLRVRVLEGHRKPDGQWEAHGCSLTAVLATAAARSREHQLWKIASM